MNGFAVINIISIKSPRFPLGEIVITANAQTQLDAVDIEQGLSRHAAADWGEVCQQDREENDYSLHHGLRLLSVYRSRNQRFWIITEWDRSVTTILMPEDY